RDQREDRRDSARVFEPGTPQARWDRREDFRDRREDIYDRREDARDRREDIRDPVPRVAGNQ
ncbi:MAG: hypothetical protein RLT30_10075, partial [Gammaproteobacteria bacterium]